MSTVVELLRPQQAWDVPLAKPLDEVLWRAWIARGRAQSRHSGAVREKVVKWVSIVGLVAAAGLWSHIPPYDVVVRFVVAAGALAVMAQAFQVRRYAFAAVFGALAILYNPLAPVFEFAGDWPRTLVVASAVPFAAALDWRNERPAHND